MRWASRYELIVRLGLVPVPLGSADGLCTTESHSAHRLTLVLTSLKIRSFKAFNAVKVGLHPFTILVGANGSGKTTLLQAVELMGALVSQTIDEELHSRDWTYSELVHKRASGQRFGFTASFDLGDVPLTWDITLHRRRGNYVAGELVKAGGKPLLRRTGREMQRLDEGTGSWESITQSLASSWLATIDANDRDRFPRLYALATWIRSIRPYIELSPPLLRRASRKTPDGIGQFGEDLSGFLRFLSDNRPDDYAALIGRIKRQYKHLDRLVIRSPGAGWNKVEVIERWGKDTVSLSSNQVSDGFLRLCAIASMRYVKPIPSILMIDEVENGVHPRLLGALIGLLQDLAQDGTQVIATTHSPIALNSVSHPESILVTRRTLNGSTRLTPLSATDGYKALHSVFRAGELWANLGEDRLLKRPPERRV